MNFRHAAGLALVGWYLMMPPLQKDLDSSCGPHSLWHPPASSSTVEAAKPKWIDYLRWLRHRLAGQQVELDTIRQRRCDMEATKVAFDAPLSQWIQVEEFASLNDCRDRYASFNHPSPPDEDRDLRSLMAEDMAKVWGKAAANMANDTSEALVRQGISAACIASDDPRLKESK